jgi:AraC-like DNA-binding protein
MIKIKNKYIFFLIVLFPFIFFTIVFFIVRTKEINIITDSNFSISEFTDASNNGNSISIIKKQKDTLFIQNILKKGYEYPYSGMQINKKNYSLFSLYDYTFKLKIHVNSDVRISFRISEYLDSYTDTLKPLSYLILVKSLGLKKGFNEIILNSNQITDVQDWWFQKNPSQINNLNLSNNLKKIKAIWFFIENTTPIDQNIEFKISEFKLAYNPLSLIFTFLYITIVYFIIVFFVIWKLKKVKYIFLPIDLTKVENKLPEAQSKILTFIATNYHNPDLKIYDVAKDNGISEEVVKELIKKYCNKTFRQYLNQIRIEEAKRLLNESNLQIAEIAFKVGYNNIQHFNRVFKEHTGDSPKSFR